MSGARDLVDPFGRVIRDLRISVTDRCNFRCTYCMPEEGMQWLPRSEVLTFEEIERLAGLMVRRYGVDSIRLTGGEPTVRARLPLLVEKLAALGIDVAMTTNGATLRLLAGENAAVFAVETPIGIVRHDPHRAERRSVHDKGHQ